VLHFCGARTLIGQALIGQDEGPPAKSQPPSNSGEQARLLQ
jgi:hypothetical protein